MPAALDSQNKKMRWLLHKANDPKHMLQTVLRSPKAKAKSSNTLLGPKGTHESTTTAAMSQGRPSPSLLTTTASLTAPPWPRSSTAQLVYRVANKGSPEVLRSPALTHRPGRSPRWSACKAERHKVGCDPFYPGAPNLYNAKSLQAVASEIIGVG